MIELIQFPHSPFCIVQRRILEYAGVKFKITNISNADRSLIWKLTKERYYEVPIIKDGKQVIFETDGTTQIIGKYIDQKYELGLFPREFRGEQNILWQYAENEIEGIAFKLTDSHYEDFTPKKDQMAVIRHKERKFGKGCVQKWAKQRRSLQAKLSVKLTPFEHMLLTRPFLLGDRPYFIDFNLYGMLGNFLYTGHYKLPAKHNELIAWYDRMSKIKAEKKK